MVMIHTKNLTKYYEEKLAVENLTLTIEEGTFYGLLGPNGAGKTTTLKMLATLLKPSSGTIKIAGIVFDRRQKAIKSSIGVVSQHFSLQREMTVNETLILHGLLHGMKRKAIKAQIQYLTEFAKMTEEIHQRIEHLSGGNKRKLMIIRAMMHQPKVLFLDEPTVGLDPSIRRDIWDLLKKLKTGGLTTIMTTHYIEEANQLCDEIGLMSKGLLVEQGSPEWYMKQMHPFVLEVFDGATTTYKYFHTREAAADYGKLLEGTLLIRPTNLEDVYVTYTNEKVNE